jgi:hypothetical protein
MPRLCPLRILESDTNSIVVIVTIIKYLASEAVADSDKYAFSPPEIQAAVPFGVLLAVKLQHPLVFLAELCPWPQIFGPGEVIYITLDPLAFFNMISRLVESTIVKAHKIEHFQNLITIFSNYKGNAASVRNVVSYQLRP